MTFDPEYVSQVLNENFEDAKRLFLSPLMVETARAVAESISDKTIVLTGAMIPYAFGSSDGLFNLGSALSFAQVLPPGVYIAMNGQCFLWDRVRKNMQTGTFESFVPGP